MAMHNKILSCEIITFDFEESLIGKGLGLATKQA